MMRLSTSQLALQVEELKAERKVLLDRLATIGLGGPLFTMPPSQDSSPATEAEEELTEEKKEEIFMSSLRPSMRARYKEMKLKRDRSSISRPPDVAYINAALDQAEALGKQA